MYSICIRIYIYICVYVGRLHAATEKKHTPISKLLAASITRAIPASAFSLQYTLYNALRGGGRSKPRLPVLGGYGGYEKSCMTLGILNFGNYCIMVTLNPNRLNSKPYMLSCRIFSINSS